MPDEGYDNEDCPHCGDPCCDKSPAEHEEEDARERRRYERAHSPEVLG